MSNDQNFKIDGLAEILQALNDLPAHLEQQILQNYIRSASNKFVVDALKSGLSYSSQIENSVKVNKDKLQYLAMVSGPTTKAFWVRFADRGTANRTNSKGANRGHVIGKFKVPGIVNSQIQPIIDSAHKDIGHEIDVFLSKNKKTL